MQITDRVKSITNEKTHIRAYFHGRAEILRMACTIAVDMQTIVTVAVIDTVRYEEMWLLLLLLLAASSSAISIIASFRYLLMHVSISVVYIWYYYVSVVHSPCAPVTMACLTRSEVHEVGHRVGGMMCIYRFGAIDGRTRISI